MTYQIINAILVENAVELSAAQAHGIATGMLCVNEQAGSSAWLAELFGETAMSADERVTDMDGFFSPGTAGIYQDEQPLPGAALVYLFDRTQHLLGSDEFEFDLFLPDDDTLLSERLEALTEWCRGYLLGVSFTDTAAEWSKEVREILKDIIEFTKLDTEAEGEEDENNFMEITEYIRTAVLLLRGNLIKKA